MDDAVKDAEEILRKAKTQEAVRSFVEYSKDEPNILTAFRELPPGSNERELVIFGVLTLVATEVRKITTGDEDDEE